MIARRLVLAAPVLLANCGVPLAGQNANADLSALERLSGGQIGFYAENLDTGSRIAWRANQRFAMCSTFKASLAAAVLERVDQGREQLERRVFYGPSDLMDYAPVAKAHAPQGFMTVEDLCKAAVELSDNTAANLLLAGIGGPSALTAFWRRHGDDVSRLDRTEPTLNSALPGDARDTTTPAAMAGNLRRFLLGHALTKTSREHLTDWMLGCKTGDKRLRAGLPMDWLIGDKTGNNGKDAAGDIAVAWAAPGTPIVVCAYVQGGSPGEEQIDATFLRLGRMAASLAR